MTLQSIPIIALVLVAGLGTVQAALMLYGMNMVRAGAHEAVRHSLARGTDTDGAIQAAETIVETSVGGLVDDLNVRVRIRERTSDLLVSVEVTGRLAAIGPIPLSVPFLIGASGVKEPLPL